MAIGAWLFSYGTLRQSDVQRAVFGRELEGRDDGLTGFRIESIRIGRPDVVAVSGLAEHPILIYTGDPADRVAGVALAVTDADLFAADGYETDDYVRIGVTLDSSRTAFVYVAAQAARANASGDSAIIDSEPPSISMRRPIARGAMRSK